MQPAACPLLDDKTLLDGSGAELGQSGGSQGAACAESRGEATLGRQLSSSHTCKRDSVRAIPATNEHLQKENRNTNFKPEMLSLRGWSEPKQATVRPPSGMAPNLPWSGSQ